ncbi:MAG: AarF/ABC1/UbiB kinase family protein [Deltaproteobacteria bacterium]|nr:AarF/ABC1/UbiB kinase family protein [Deltaproteobacteria bacterium]
MILDIYKKLSPAIGHGVSSIKRLRQTAMAIGVTGVKWILDGRPASPVVMRQAFERLGATYIKLGQLIASSPSIFPESYVKEFQRCLDQTEPVPFVHMEKVLEQELGSRYLIDVFEHINPIPLASASIAQVYAARLKTGEDVVIKIQRPRVLETLTTDLNFLLFGATVLEVLVPRLKHASVAGILSEIRNTVLEECNFVKEAENIEIFSKFLKDTHNTSVVTPRVYHRASSERVLTMERLHGICLTDRKQFLNNTKNPRKVLGAAFETWVASLSGCELFHADLHAGNLMILLDGRVGFIDFGIVGRISKKTQAGVKALIKSMMILDFTVMAESMLTIGMTQRKVDIDLLAGDLETVFAASESMDPAVPVSEPDQFLLEIVRIAEVHGIRFPREFTLLLKQFLYFDSYGDIMFNMEDMMDDMMDDMEFYRSLITEQF